MSADLPGVDIVSGAEVRYSEALLLLEFLLIIRRCYPNQFCVVVACLSGLSPFDFRDVVGYDGINHPGDAYPSAKPRVAGHLKFIRTCPKGPSAGLG